VRVDGESLASVVDAVAVEAPLDVYLDGEPFSVIMRTPGADRDLVAGFLFSEGVVSTRADVASFDIGEDRVEVTLSATRASALPGLLDSRRHVAMNSSCGMCGRRSAESLHLDVRPLSGAATPAVTADAILAMPAVLRHVQDAFSRTGGLHAAGLFDRQGGLETSAEDVGRHNAVDKLIGRMWLADRLPLTDRVLFVSGRLSFEIVQKAMLAGLPIVAAVSAPSSLAVDLGTEAGMTLVGFVRHGRFNIYAHAGRVATRPAG